MIIQIDDLRKRYGTRKAVDGVTLSVDEEEIIVLLGLMFGVAHPIVQWRRDDLPRLSRTTSTPVSSMSSAWHMVTVIFAIAFAALVPGTAELLKRTVTP